MPTPTAAPSRGSPKEPIPARQRKPWGCQMPDTGLTALALATPALAAALFVMAAARAVRRRGVRRLYWAACAILIGVGSAGTVSVVCCAPAMTGADGAVIAEMPPAFGVALTLAVAGCCGALLGLLGLGVFGLASRRRSRVGDAGWE